MTVPCKHTSRVEILESRSQVIGGVRGVQARMGFHLVYVDDCGNRNELTAFVVVEEFYCAFGAAEHWEYSL